MSHIYNDDKENPRGRRAAPKAGKLPVNPFRAGKEKAALAQRAAPNAGKLPVNPFGAEKLPVNPFRAGKEKAALAQRAAPNAGKLPVNPFGAEKLPVNPFRAGKEKAALAQRAAPKAEKLPVNAVGAGKEKAPLAQRAAPKAGKLPVNAVGAGKEKAPLAQRVNGAVPNSNYNYNGNPTVGFHRVIRKVKHAHGNDAVAPKRSHMGPVMRQFKEFSIYSDDVTTKVAVTGQPYTITGPAYGFDLKSLEESSSSDDIEEESDSDTDELLPRNDRERFFEVAEYQQDILEHLRETEKKHRPMPNYMRRQKDLDNSMRIILVDWMVEVGEEYNLDGETLYLSVSYVDRFLSQMSVVRHKLQLVGAAAMYIASKYEEVYALGVNEFVFLTAESYTKEQILRMEQVMLKMLSFDLGTPTPYGFINAYSVMCAIPKKLKCLAHYISELAMLEGEPYLPYLPSLIACASLALARRILEMPMWTPQLEKITTYKLEDLKTVVLQLSQTHKVSKELPTQGLLHKFDKVKYKQVSSIGGIELTAENFDQLCEAKRVNSIPEVKLI